MDDITWLEISIHTTPEQIDAITEQLTARGMTGLVIEEEQEFQAFLAQNRQYWDYVDEELLQRMKGVARVRFYVTDDETGQRQIAQYLSGLPVEYTVTPLAEHDWAYSWQTYYKPLPVGQRLYIVPDWEREAELPAKRLPLYLNPGLTFGTGSHASTQLCLEGLEPLIRPETTVLDLGCGSGILSIAALVLGARHALAVDIDPIAVNVAYENAALNGIGRERYTVLDGDILSNTALRGRLLEGKYDLILANIVADVIIPLSQWVPQMLAQGGSFLCSGIIDSRQDEVCAALEQNGLSLRRRRENNGWVALESAARG